MTTQEMLDWFDVLQDKFGSPYFNTAQKLIFLNNAQNEYLNKLFPDNEGGIQNIEQDWNILQNVSPLVWELPEQSMDTNAVIPISTIVTALQTASSDVNTGIFDVLSVEVRRGLDRFPCKVLRHNDKAEFETNFFKKPTAITPRYLLQNNTYKFRPLDTTLKIIFTVVKEPRKLSISPTVNSEFPNQTHNELVAYGLQFAGIASRDEVLSTMNLLQLPKKD